MSQPYLGIISLMCIYEDITTTTSHYFLIFWLSFYSILLWSHFQNNCRGRICFKISLEPLSPASIGHISSAHEEFCLIQAIFCHFSKCDVLACNIIFLVQNWLENMKKRSKIQNLLFEGRNWLSSKFQCKIAQFYLILKNSFFVFFSAKISSKWKIIDSMT